MSGMGWAAIVLALIVAGVAAWRVLRLAREVAALKREHYYADNRLKQISREIDEAVDPLRAQLARVASGLPVSPDVIRAGRRYLDVPADVAQQWLDDGEAGSGRVIVIDVRTAKEFAARHIPGAKLVPFEELDRRYASDVPPTVERLLLYCASGERSRMACDFLSGKGYANLYNLENGLQAWRGATEGEGELRFIQLERKR